MCAMHHCIGVASETSPGKAEITYFYIREMVAAGYDQRILN
jgi:hypothetical protein